MAQYNNFRIITNPFTGSLLTSLANVLYFDSYNGSDNNNGRSKNLAKHTLECNNGLIHVLHGKFDDINVNNSGADATFIGDGFAKFGISWTYGTSNSQRLSIHGCYLTSFIFKMGPFGDNVQSFFLKNCKIDVLQMLAYANYIRYLSLTDCIVDIFIGSSSTTRGIINVTFNSLFWNPLSDTDFTNCIFNNSIDLYNTSNYIPYFKYCLFRKQISWKWNNTVIIAPDSTGIYNWDNCSDLTDSNVMLMYLKEKLLAYASVNNLTTLTNMVNLMFNNCKIYDDSETASVRIYNCYDADKVTPNGNYSLSNTSGNPALTCSDEDLYVGGMKPSLRFIFDFNNIINIDNYGNTVAGAADLIVTNDGDKLYLNQTSEQHRNKISSHIITLPVGQKLNSFSSYFIPSTGDLQYWGMFQGITSGHNTPINCLLIEPFDTATSTYSSDTLKKMFVPFNQEVLLAVYSRETTVGNNTRSVGDYVTYEDLATLVGYATNKNLSENLGTVKSDATYDTLSNCIVSNAVDEWDDLVALTNISTVKLSGLFKYFKCWLIANNDPNAL